MENCKGVTLIALIVTVAILGIFISVVAATSTEVINYTAENKFVSEIKIIREKVNIVNKEISVGSVGYDNVGKELSDVSTTLRNRLESILTKCDASGNDYKYVSSNELNKIGVYGIDHNVLIDFKNIHVISVDGIEINGEIYYTKESVEKIM